jgi:hypothetical protein
MPETTEGQVAEQSEEQQVPAQERSCDPMPQHVQEHYDAIREQERKVRDLEGVFLDDKAAAKESKERFELADKTLRDLIARGPDPQKKLPLITDPPAEDAWKLAPFAELGLTERQNNLFAESGVTTIGGLEEMRAAIADGKAEWPKGIGPTKVTDIENRVLDWLDRNRDHFGEADDSSSLTEEVSDAFEAAGILAK